MARTTSVWNFVLFGLLAHASVVWAQQTPSSAPPKLERADEGSDTPITVTPQQRGAPKITETRENGRTTEVQVTTGKSSYTMKAHPPGAVSQPGDSGSGLRPPQWTVLEFDFGKKKQKALDEAASATADVPPPPLPATPPAK